MRSTTCRAASMRARAASPRRTLPPARATCAMASSVRRSSPMVCMRALVTGAVTSRQERENRLIPAGVPIQWRTEDPRSPMSTEKDGTEVPPSPDPQEGVDSDVTQVKETPLPGVRTAGGGEVDDEVTRVKSMSDAVAAAQEAPAGPPAMPHQGEADGEADGEIETMDDADVETVEDDAVLEEDLDETPLDAPGALHEAIADAQNLLGESAHLRHTAMFERELEVLARGEPDKARTALYQHEIGELTESRAGDEGAAVKAYARALQSDATL